MGQRYVSYDASLEFLKIKTLQERQEIICLSFAPKCLASKKFYHLFNPMPQNNHNLRETRKLIEPKCYTERYKNSPLVYLTKLLNTYYSTKNVNAQYSSHKTLLCIMDYKYVLYILPLINIQIQEEDFCQREAPEGDLITCSATN